MSGALSLHFSTQSQVDLRRISRELMDLQRQVSSGAVADDLQGFGSASTRLLTARTLKSTSDARASVINQAQGRFAVQAASLGQAAQGARLLAQAIEQAIAADDGRGISIELDLSFSSIVNALNQTWNGQPLFAGERQDGAPIKISTLDDLLLTTGPDDIFDESERRQVLDLGAGDPVTISAKASELSQGLFDTLRAIKEYLNLFGGTIGQPISAAQRTTLLGFAQDLETHAQTLNQEEGRSGQLQKRFEAESAQLQQRSDLLVKEIGDQADADLAEVSMRLNALMVQYEASAKTFADLSKLSLLNYL